MRYVFILFFKSGLERVPKVHIYFVIINDLLLENIIIWDSVQSNPVKEYFFRKLK